MEKICVDEPINIFELDFAIVEMIKLLDIQEIVKLRCLNSRIREMVDNENYELFQKLRDFLHIPSTFDSSDLASKENIFHVFKKVLEAFKQKPQNINPFAFYTDGGVDTNSNYYFLQNLWKKTGICYCTVSHSNVHVQSILSRKVELPAVDNNPMNFLENPKNKLKIRIPMEKYFVDEEEPFQILSNFQIHLRSGGYNAYVQSFALFYSEKEIDNTKFQALTKRFTKVEKFNDLELTRLSILDKEEDKEAGIKIVEFNVSDREKIEKCYRTKSLSVYPLLWVHIKQKYINKTYKYEFRQKVAAKYLSLKLLKSSNSNANSNIDCYNLGLQTVPLSLESASFD